MENEEEILDDDTLTVCPMCGSNHVFFNEKGILHCKDCQVTLDEAFTYGI